MDRKHSGAKTQEEWTLEEKGAALRRRLGGEIRSWKYQHSTTLEVRPVFVLDTAELDLLLITAKNDYLGTLYASRTSIGPYIYHGLFWGALIVSRQ